MSYTLTSVSLPSAADPVGRQRRWLHPHAVAIAHRLLLQVGRDQHAPARLDGERARVVAVCVDALHQLWFAALRVDGEHRHGILAAGGDLLALHLDQSACAVAQIDEPAAWMDVDRPDHLLRAQVPGILQRGDHESRLLLQVATVDPVHLQLVLSLDGNVHPPAVRVEIHMARPEAEAVAWRDGGNVRQLTVLHRLDLQRAGIFRLGVGLVVAARHQHQILAHGRPSMRRQHADLVRVDPSVDRRRLLRLLPDRGIRRDACTDIMLGML